MSEFVLDASAVLGVFRGEQGSDFVVDRCRGSLISSVNVAEVLSHIDVRNASRDFVETALRTMRLQEIPFDREQAEVLATIYPRTVGSSVGFADRACLALAKSRGLIALTGDRDWLKHDVGVQVQLFRQSQAA